MHIINSYGVLQNPNICFESRDRNSQSLILGIKNLSQTKNELVLVPAKLMTIWNQRKAIFHIGPLAKTDFNILQIHHYIAENFEILKFYGQYNVQFLNNIKKVMNITGNSKVFLPFNPQHKLYRLQWIHAVMENFGISFSKSKLICSKIFRADEISEKAKLKGLIDFALPVINMISEESCFEKRKLISDILRQSLQDTDKAKECVFFLHMTYVKRHLEYDFRDCSFSFQQFKNCAGLFHKLIHEDKVALDEFLKLGKKMSHYIPCNKTVEIIKHCHDNLGTDWKSSLRDLFPLLTPKANINHINNPDFILLFSNTKESDRREKIRTLKELYGDRFSKFNFDTKKNIFLSLQGSNKISPVKKAL